MELALSISIALIVLGVILLLIEAASPGNFIIVPASVLIVLGFIGMIFPDFLLSVWSPLLAFILLVPMTLISIKLYQRLAPPGPPETVVATSLIGKEGVVTMEVKPNTLTGKVRIDHDTWSATSDRVIPMGRRVVVTSSEGVHVTVQEK